MSALALPACGDDIGSAPSGDTTSGGTGPVPGGSSSSRGDGPGASDEVSGNADAADATSAEETTGGETTRGSDGDTTEGVVDDTSTGEPPSPCDAIDCDDADPCTDDSCDEMSRACVHIVAPGNRCDDGDACTEGDTCQPDGTCGPGEDVCTIEHCGTISTDETWGPEVVHVLTCPVYVEGPTNPALTILDGTIVLAEPGSALLVGVQDPGRMQVQGTELGVSFTNAQPLPAGEWHGLIFGTDHNDSAVVGATIERAGVNGDAGLTVAGFWSPLVVAGTTIRESPGTGVLAVNTVLEMHDSAVVDSGGTAIHVAEQATLEMHGTSLVGNGGDGVAFEWGGRMADVAAPFTDNVITENGGAPLRMDANDLRHLDASSSFAGNAERIAVGGSVSTSGTWRLLDEDFSIELAIDIVSSDRGDVVVEIEPGVTFYLADGAIVATGYFDIAGALHAVGTAEAPIRFVGGRLVFFESGLPGSINVLDHVIVEDGDGIELYQGAVHVTDSIIRNNHGVAGIFDWGYGGELGVSGTVIEDNQGFGVDVVHPFAFPFVDNVVTGNDFAIFVPAGAVADLSATSTFVGNTDDHIAIRGTHIEESSTWPALDVPYRAYGIQILGDSMLTLEPGVTIEFAEDAALTAGFANASVEPPIVSPGGLIAIGTPEAPITFRSASATPSPGDWAGILVQSFGLPTTLEYCVVQHAGGGGFDGAIVVRSDAVTISSCTIVDSAEWGIYQDGAAATLSGNTYAGNASGDVFP